ncbi:hypothetical protein LCGC14_2998840, partial [marine sediment metagenome]
PRSITLSFPWFPPEVAPNWTGHRMKKASATKAYREQCGWAAVEQSLDAEHVTVCLSSPVLATTTFYVTDRRRRDMNNLDASLKALWDGIVDAGILADDSSEHLQHGRSRLVRNLGGLGPKEKYIEVRLEEVG